MSARSHLGSLSALVFVAVLAGACQSEPSSTSDATVQTYGASVDTASARAVATVAATGIRVSDA